MSNQPNESNIPHVYVDECTVDDFSLETSISWGFPSHGLDDTGCAPCLRPTGPETYAAGGCHDHGLPQSRARQRCAWSWIGTLKWILNSYECEFQDPKMEVPTIYKAYIRPM